MAVTADSVVIELLAKTDGYVANINGASNATTTALTKIEQSASRAEVQIVRSTGQMANAQRNLERQVSDIGTQLAGGQSPFLILAQQAQQAPQVADALADTGGKAASVAAFFAGPWGAALLAAGSALGVLVGKALESGDSLESLIDKLKEAAEKTRLTAEAQRIFEASADGAAAAIDKLNEALGKANVTQARALQLDLARAKTLRQVQIQALKVAEANAQVARDEASRAGGSNTQLLLRGQGGGQAQALYAKQAASAERDLTLAKQRRLAAENAVTNASVPLLDYQAAGAADKATAATQRHEKALQKLRDAYIGASQAAKTNDQREAATRAYREGRTRIDVGLAAEQKAISESEKKKPKGPSAATLAARAEAARVKEVRNNEAYNNELEQINGQIISAQRERAVSASEVANFERQAVESEYRKRKDAIAADLSAKKYTAAQAGTLDQANEQSRLLRLRNVEINEQVRTIQDMARRDVLTLNIAEEQLQADQQIAETRDERKRIELELISLKYQERRIQLDALRRTAKAAGDTGAADDLTEQIAALPGLRRADERGVEQQSRGQYERYRRNLDSADSLADSIDAVKIDTLEAITDELTQATTAALGLKGAFGQIVGELIRIGIQRRLIGPLSDALFGKADGSTSGNVGNLLASASKIFGRASGGYVAPGGVVRVNEGRGSGVELLRMGSQGGSVIPLGQSATRPARAPTIVNQSFNLDARYGITTPELLSYVQQTARTEGTRAGGAAFVASQRSTPGTLAQYDKLEG